MSIVSAIIDEILKIVGIIIWPALVFFAIVRYDKEIRELIKRIKKISGAGVSAEMTEEVNEIARKASEIPQKEVQTDEESENIVNLKNLAESDPQLALAKVRIEIEKQLHLLYDIYFPDNARHGSRLSPRSLLDSLRKKGIIEPPLAAVLLDIIGVANKAIHGEDISSENAVRLIDTANTALTELEYVILNHALKTAKSEIVDQSTVEAYANAEYLLTTITPLVHKPEKKTYKLNQAELNAFLEGYNNYGEFIIELQKINENGKQGINVPVTGSQVRVSSQS
jgi:hypothetical protein